MSVRVCVCVGVCVCVNVCAAFDDGRAIACATTSDHTQKLLRILLFGSLKSLQDLSEELHVQVNWVDASCATT